MRLGLLRSTTAAGLTLLAGAVLERVPLDNARATAVTFAVVVEVRSPAGKVLFVALAQGRPLAEFLAFFDFYRQCVNLSMRDSNK